MSQKFQLGEGISYQEGGRVSEIGIDLEDGVATARVVKTEHIGTEVLVD